MPAAGTAKRTAAGATAVWPKRLKTFGAGLALAIVAFGLTHGLRTSGAMQGLELGVYDILLRLTGDEVSAVRDDVVIITHTETDEARYGTILPDDVLARLLAGLNDLSPLAIGLDLIRDRPEPSLQEGPSAPSLEDVIGDMNGLVAIVKDTAPGFASPPILADHNERLGAADIVRDADGIVRRGLLFVTANGKTRPTLALQLAARRLRKEGLESRMEGDRFVMGNAVFPPLIPSRSGYYQDEAVDGGYQFLLRYPACSSGFVHHPVEDIVEGREMPDLAGKVVLVGNRLALSKDLFTTPDQCGELAGRRMFGVELQAQIVAQLIDQGLKAAPQPSTTGQWVGDIELGLWLDRLWIGLWCVLGVLLVLVVRSPPFIAIAALLGLAGLFGLGYGAFLMLAWWLPLVPPAAGFLLALALMGGFTLMATRVERDTLWELLAGVVSKRVADTLWQQRSKLAKDELAPPELMMATVMFTDIKGFTTISELLPEPVLAEWLNEYLEAMVEIVTTHDGVIEKFAGDGLTIEFGPPDRRTTRAEIETDARNAFATALAMEARLITLNRSWIERGWPEIGIRIGIHSGELMVGAVGGASRFQYSIIGDTANTAARLEAYGKDDPALQADVGECRILLSDVTYQYLNNDVDVELVGHVSLRGKANDVTVYRAITPGMSR